MKKRLTSGERWGRMRLDQLILTNKMIRERVKQASQIRPRQSPNLWDSALLNSTKGSMQLW